MDFGDCEIVREKENIRILKNGCRDGRESFCVVGEGSTKCYDDYEDALEEFNLRWMRKRFGE